MKTKKILYINGRKIELYSFGFGCYHESGYQGKVITHDPKGLTIAGFAFANKENTFLKDLAFRNKKIDGTVAFEYEDSGSRKLHFVGATVACYRERFVADSGYPMMIYFEFCPIVIDYDGANWPHPRHTVEEYDALEAYMKKEEARVEQAAQEEEEEDNNCPHCKKEHVDLRKEKGLVFAKQQTDTDCKSFCDKIIKAHAGFESEGGTGKPIPNAKYNSAFYQLALEDETHKFLVFDPDKKMNEAFEYLDLALDLGYSMVVGVHHTMLYNKDEKRQKDNELTTDHFVIIVGRHCENGQVYYRFWDVGSEYGESRDYKFILNKDKSLTCANTYRPDKRSYTVTQIRRFAKDKAKGIYITLEDLKNLPSKRSK